MSTPGVKPYPWRGLLCLNGMSGYHETPVLVVGETPKQYRVEAIERMRLAGRMRWLNPGERVLVPRYAIKPDPVNGDRRAATGTRSDPGASRR